MHHSQQLMILMVKRNTKPNIFAFDRQIQPQNGYFAFVLCAEVNAQAIFRRVSVCTRWTRKLKCSPRYKMQWECKPNEMNADNKTVCLHSNSKQFLSRNHNNNKEKTREKKTAISCCSLRFYYCLLTTIITNTSLSVSFRIDNKREALCVLQFCNKKRSQPSATHSNAECCWSIKQQ